MEELYMQIQIINHKMNRSIHFDNIVSIKKLGDSIIIRDNTDWQTSIEINHDKNIKIEFYEEI